MAAPGPAERRPAGSLLPGGTQALPHRLEPPRLRAWRPARPAGTRTRRTGPARRGSPLVRESTRDHRARRLREPRPLRHARRLPPRARRALSGSGCCGEASRRADGADRLQRASNHCAPLRGRGVRLDVEARRAGGAMLRDRQGEGRYRDCSPCARAAGERRRRGHIGSPRARAGESGRDRGWRRRLRDPLLARAARVGRRRPRRAGGADERVDIPLRRARRPAALVALADEDDDGERRALSDTRGRGGARDRLARGRLAAPRVVRGADGGDLTSGGVGKDVRPPARPDLGRRGARALSADVDRPRARRRVPAHRRLRRPEPAHVCARRGGAAARGGGGDADARDRDRGRPRTCHRDRDGSRLDRDGDRRQRRWDVRGGARRARRSHRPDRADGARVPRARAVGAAARRCRRCAIRRFSSTSARSPGG